MRDLDDLIAVACFVCKTPGFTFVYHLCIYARFRLLWPHFAAICVTSLFLRTESCFGIAVM